MVTDELTRPAEASGLTGRTWLEIDLQNLEHNVRVLEEAMPEGCRLMAVVKARAYGHGAYEIATRLEKLHVRAFAVATIDEGIELRRLGITGEILILGYTSPRRAGELHEFDLMQTLIDESYAADLDAQGYAVKAHMAIDTGMHRLGFPAEDMAGICRAFALKNLDICGIFTHLCVSDSLEPEDVHFTKGQIDCFYGLLDRLRARGIPVPRHHIQSSYGLLNYPELRCDYVRVGIALYGVLSAPNDETRLQLNLKPVLALKSRLVLVRSVRAGETVGYGRAFTAQRDSRIGILPVGYADGFPRSLSCGNGSVLIGGRRAPIVGRICMDQTAVDVTDIPEAAVGMTATLIGADGEAESTAPAVAELTGSIANELFSRLGPRLDTVVVGK